MPCRSPLAALLCLPLLVASLRADVLGENGFQGEVVHGRLHLLSVHAEGRQLVIAAPEYHLAVRADLPPGAAPRPARLAWILPIPAGSERVVALPGGTPVWGELSSWCGHHLAHERSPGDTVLTPFASARATDLRITAGTGPAAIVELNAWLSGAGFPTPDAARLDSLASGAYRFALAIYTATSDAEPLPATGILPAIAYEGWSTGLGLPVQLAGQHPLDLAAFSVSKSGLEIAREPLQAWLGAELSQVELAAAEDLPRTIEVARSGPALALPRLEGHWFVGEITGRIEAGRGVGSCTGVMLAGAADLESRHDASADRKRKVVMFGVVMVLGLGLGILYGRARQRARSPSA